jgi:pimeloyl-ACP methyl ester carboxylesterase
MAIMQLTIAAEDFPFLESGEGEPLLFLHGAPGDCRTWRAHLRLLSKRCRAIAYTQRWFGTHRWREAGRKFGVRTHARDLADFVEALGAGPVSLVAWSYSGHVALSAALARPELFRRILVYEPGVPTWVRDPDELQRFGELAAATFGPIFEASARGNREEAVRRLIDASGGAGYFDSEDPERRALHLDSAHAIPLLLAQQKPPRIGCRDLATLPVPVTIAWGADTSPLFEIPSRTAAACVGGARHIVVPGAGHLWPEETPEAFADMIARWLDRG